VLNAALYCGSILEVSDALWLLGVPISVIILLMLFGFLR
jgi:hypothetical protein